MTPASERIFRQHGKKLSAPQAYLEGLADGRFGLFRAGQKSGKPQAIIDAADVVAWQKADLLQGDISLEISPQVRAHLRRFVAGGACIAHHKGMACAAHDSAVTQTQTTPLQWLQARQQDKHFGLQDIEFEAGHRLAQDYDHAAYQPRQTMDWQRPFFCRWHAADRRAKFCWQSSRCAQKTRCRLGLYGARIIGCGAGNLLCRSRVGGLRARLFSAQTLSQINAQNGADAAFRALWASIGGGRGGIVSNALNHRVKSVGALRRQVIAQAQLGKSPFGVKSGNFGAAFAII